ncbi:hypothetical protein BCR34DRAFT_593390 [Clohesyomyces aquaticus]|uniref:Uncharacterized protein n=1 Tax=Clohesyomyces aquaticus TaxID=1231657 RepID=A0A1Y1YJN7_9PLEO|nr:hypothetical protein BCR34DRAFT_593390 [Clohesyomyces aquaticus]
MSSGGFTSSFSSFPAFIDDASNHDLHTGSPQKWSPSPDHPELLRRNASYNTAMRQSIASWNSWSGDLPPPPPGCKAILSSRWRRFSSRRSSLSSEDMKASVLWAPRGTTPQYSPPISEWFDFMGIDKTEPVLIESDLEPISFKKEEVKVEVKASLLTESLRLAFGAGLQRQERPIEVLCKGMGKGKLSPSMLPSAWDSDDEDED